MNPLWLAGVVAISLILPASAHEAPTGWSYDQACCSNRDCQPEHGEVRATDNGWLVTSTGETVPYDDHRIKTSRDGDFHRCQVASRETLRCLYVPPQGF